MYWVTVYDFLHNAESVMLIIFSLHCLYALNRAAVFDVMLTKRGC